LRDLSTHKDIDLQKEQELDRLYQEILERPDAPELHYRRGQLHLQMDEPFEALQYFEAALKLDPKNDAFKIAYAEAGLNLKEHDNISLKGKRRRVEAFEIVGMKDPLDNRDKIPQALYDRYGNVGERIKIPEDVTLPTEVVDGSIGQSRIVAVLSYAMADSMGLPEREKNDILSAGFLADIGKEMISPDLRNRRGGLTVTELELVRQHPDESCRLMRKMGYDNPAMLNLVQHNHEHFRGGGYPGNLQGENIPTGSRIIAVADAYDALTSWRPYRESWDRRAALGEIRREVDKGMFDPAVVEALARLVA